MWMATAIATILFPATIALLADFHHAVAAQRRLRLCEATFGTACFGIENRVDAVEAARRELVVVALVP